jgi:pyruvate kinase
VKKKDTVVLGFTKGDITFNLNIIKSLKKGHKILLNNGELEFEITRVKQDFVEAVALKSGPVLIGKGVNVPGVDFNWPYLCPKDKEVLPYLVKWQPDFIGVSFIRSKEQMDAVKKYWAKEKIRPLFIAKIEHQKALDNLKDIIDVSDGAMVARGDLGLEVPIHEVALWQKRIIKQVNLENKISIVATEMLESMVSAPIPTRAEVSDVTNAVIDDTDAVMLSDETTVGEYPFEAVRIMRNIVEAVENSPEFKNLPKIKCCNDFYTILSEAAKTCLSNYQFKAIVVFSLSGKTAIALSKIRAKVPIYAFTPSEHTFNQLSLAWKVTPVLSKNDSKKDMLESAILSLKKNKNVRKGDYILSISGKSFSMGTTDTLKIVKIE